MQITDLSKIKATEIKEFSPFLDGTKLVAEVKRVDFQRLIVSGVLPNTLISKAEQLFKNGNNKRKEKEIVNLKDMPEMFKIIDTIAEHSLVNPSKEELKKHGIELSLQQLLDIFNWNMKPITDLENFRS